MKEKSRKQSFFIIIVLTFIFQFFKADILKLVIGTIDFLVYTIGK